MPNPTVSSRLARLDLRYYSPDSGHIVKGDIGQGKVWYCDGMSMNPIESYPLLKQMEIEGRFSAYLPGGTLSQVAIQDNFPHKKSLIDFMTTVFQRTDNSHLYFTPDKSANVFNLLK